MSESKNSVVKMDTALSQWTNSVTTLVEQDFQTCGVQMDDYARQCAMAAMSSIWQLVRDSDKLKDLNDLDRSNLRDVVGKVASLRLNALAQPSEVYFQLRTKKINDTYVQQVDVGIQGSGNDAILRNFGEGVVATYPWWIIKDGDYYSAPIHKGIEVVPPEWEEKGLSQKVVRVVLPVRLVDGTVEYLTADREGVRTNLMAHVRNNLMNECFNLAKSRYTATADQKAQIDAKKEEIYSALRTCVTVDDMLACEIARPYISAAWLDTPESMITRKMQNNAVKHFPKNFDTMAKQSYNAMDETYVVSQEEIAEEANKEELEILDV